ncbi:PHD finger protein 10 isoform X1 [Lingula anatina]|uniref:PHD finger protein 10 n=2 Tax=Lingula anatina TaxID=7574 RepID=A0A1S3JNA5_LINAN|nr:PHD finger protein 10 isoform X1 [Lingula anatina]|eukprot:XP_013411434.1 PHD finger protein 10 isoform X1 [Lingula anatina]
MLCALCGLSLSSNGHTILKTLPTMEPHDNTPVPNTKFITEDTKELVRDDDKRVTFEGESGSGTSEDINADNTDTVNADNTEDTPSDDIDSVSKSITTEDNEVSKYKDQVANIESTNTVSEKANDTDMTELKNLVETDMSTNPVLSPAKTTQKEDETICKETEKTDVTSDNVDIISPVTGKIPATDDRQKSPVVVLSKIDFPKSLSGNLEKTVTSQTATYTQDEDSQMSTSKPEEKNDENKTNINSDGLVYMEEDSRLSRDEESVKIPGAFPLEEDSQMSLAESCVSRDETVVGTEAEDNNDQEGKEKKPKKKSAKKRRSSVSLIEDNAHITKGFNADDLFEYQWPQDKTGEWYMLQEQVSEYLEVLSFKRKYPDLTRRPLEYLERIYLKENGVVTEQQCDLGLSPLKSEEVCDLMQKDYPAKYQEYLVVLQQRERQRIKEKHKEYGMQQEQQKNKMDYYMKKAIKSAADFNAQFMKERREERKAYFDLQTFSVHYPKNKFKVLDPSATKPSAYPVALIPGQFHEYYKQYSAEELKYLPVNTVVYGPPKCVKAMGEGEEGIASDTEQSDAASDGGSGSGSSSSGSSDSDEVDNSQEKHEDELRPPDGAKCHVCDSGAEANKSGKPEDLVMCAECKRCGHPSCLDLTVEMAPIIKTYPWQCMECKTCVECMDPYDEDKMMFCDHCDRGYHTFCVGLRSIPNGRWECPSCYIPPEPAPKRSRKR